MRLLNLSLNTPEHNVALDEALLDYCEEHPSVEILRFWEPDTHFVVVGYGNSVDMEVRADQCRRDGVPILRRCSGGGAVLQGPGSLNYALILQLESRPELANVQRAICHILQQHRSALQPLLDVPLATQGISDLAVNGRKCSGNAQRRKRRCILFHGTLLTSFDISRVARYLPMPSLRPDYRADRSHEDFLTNLPLSPDTIHDALQAAWRAQDRFIDAPLRHTQTLVDAKYTQHGWTFKR